MYARTETQKRLNVPTDKGLCSGKVERGSRICLIVRSHPWDASRRQNTEQRDTQTKCCLLKTALRGDTDEREDKRYKEKGSGRAMCGKRRIWGTFDILKSQKGLICCHFHENQQRPTELLCLGAKSF